jgi:hypothetical protein
VDVHVDEPGHHEPAAYVDDPRARGIHPGTLVDRGDVLAVDDEGPGRNDAVRQDEVTTGEDDHAVRVPGQSTCR